MSININQNNNQVAGQIHRGATRLSYEQAGGVVVQALSHALRAINKFLPPNKQEEALDELLGSSCPTSSVTCPDGTQLMFSHQLEKLVQALKTTSRREVVSHENNVTVLFFRVPDGYRAYKGEVGETQLVNFVLKGHEYASRISILGTELPLALVELGKQINLVWERKRLLGAAPEYRWEAVKYCATVPRPLADELTFVVDNITKRLLYWQPGRNTSRLGYEARSSRIILTSSNTTDIPWDSVPLAEPRQTAESATVEVVAS